MKSVRFRCPHCQSVVEIPAVKLGSAVECPREECGLVFNATPPSGEMYSDQPGGESVTGVPVASGSLESTLFERHPAMFRNRPFSSIALWSLLILGSIGFFGGLAGTFEFGLPAGVLMIVSGAVAVGAGVGLLVWWIRMMATTLIVTTERTILRRGLLDRHSSEVLHEDVRNLQMNQSFTDRLMGVGSLALSSSGQDDLEIEVKGIPNPDEIVQTIRQHQADD